MKMRKKNDTAVYSTGTKVIRFLVVLLMSFVAFLTLYPIFYVVLGAFKKNQELLTGGSIFSHLNGSYRILLMRGILQTLRCTQETVYSLL